MAASRTACFADEESAAEMLTVGFNSVTTGYSQRIYTAKLMLGFS